MKTKTLLIVLILSLIIVGGVIFTNFLALSKFEDIIQNQLKEHELTKTRFMADQIENHIYDVRDELMTLSKFPIMENLDINSCTGDMKIVHEKIEGKIDSLLRVDKEGNILECSSPQFSDYIGLNIKNKDYFISPKESNGPFVSSVIIHGDSPQIIVSAPLFEINQYTPNPSFEGKFQGVLLSIIDINNLYYRYIHPGLGVGEYFYMLRDVNAQRTILQSPELPEYENLKSYFGNTTNNVDIITDFNGYGRTVITSADIKFEKEVWTLFRVTPLEKIMAETSGIQQRHIFNLVFTGLVIIVSFFFLFALYKSHQELQLKLNRTAVTLEKLGISIDVEEDKFNQADLQLDPHKIYLIKDDEENHAHELFISSLNRGYAGLGIVREDPRVLKKKYNLSRTSFIWMSKTEVENVPTEVGIINLLKIITEFVSKGKKSVILIDRVDYLFTENEDKKVIQCVHSLKDLIVNSDCIIIMSAFSELISPVNMKSIESEAVDIYGQNLKQSIALSDIEKNILKFINDKNINNSLVSYKDITATFQITKPTTRAKIRKLRELGLLEIEQKGRYKSLRITSLGRRANN